MARKKDNPTLEEHAAQLALRYTELEKALAVITEDRDGLVNKVIDLEQRIADLKKNRDELYADGKAWAERCRQAERETRELRESRDLIRRDLDRCMGWIDKSRDCPPALQYSELPF